MTADEKLAVVNEVLHRYMNEEVSAEEALRRIEAAVNEIQIREV